MVVVEITTWPTASRGPVGKVVEVLGDINEQGVDTEIIIRKFGIPTFTARRQLRSARSGLSARRISTVAPISVRPSR
jgi:ribonuclease R